MSQVAIGKAHKPQQFKIQDPDKRIVAGWASVEIVDKQGDIVPIDVIERAMYDYMARGGDVFYGHNTLKVGKVVRWEVKTLSDGTPGIWIEVQLDRGEVADRVWQAIKDGRLLGFSIGGVGTEEKKKIKSDDGTEREVDVITRLELHDISIVESPANPAAVVEAVNYMAKQEGRRPPKDWWDRCVGRAESFADDPEAFCGWLWYHGEEEGFGSLREAFGKSDEDVFSAFRMISKPFAGFRNFDECVKEMRGQGYDEDAARRICGKLYWEHERGRKKGETRNIYKPTKQEIHGETLSEEEREERPRRPAEKPAEKPVESPAEQDKLSELLGRIDRLISILERQVSAGEAVKQGINEVRRSDERKLTLSDIVRIRRGMKGVRFGGEIDRVALVKAKVKIAKLERDVEELRKKVEELSSKMRSYADEAVEASKPKEKVPEPEVSKAESVKAKVEAVKSQGEVVQAESQRPVDVSKSETDVKALFEKVSKGELKAEEIVKILRGERQ